MPTSNDIATTALSAVDASALASNTVYLMGMTFILGVLFTVFILLALDFMRRNAEDNAVRNAENESEEEE